MDDRPFFASLGAIVMGLCMLIMLAVTKGCASPTQARGGVSTGRIATGIIDLPGVNEQVLENLLSEMDKRIAEVEAARTASGQPAEENMSWQEWMYVILGSGTLGTLGAGVLNKRMASSRSHGRVKLVQALTAVLRGTPEAENGGLAKLLRQANLSGSDVAVVESELKALLEARKKAA